MATEVDSVTPEKTTTDCNEKNDTPNSDVNGTNNVGKEPNDLEKQIIRQIEYYFGDINLPRDKFMLEQIKLDNGWISMNTMIKFQRLAKLSTDPKVIAAALHHSQLMEVNEEGDEMKIRRSPEIPLPEMNEERRKELQQRTIYIKGFPLDSEIDKLINFFNPYGPAENIIMRKYKDKISKSYKFKGSVFATFSSIDKAKEFLDIESVKYDDVELIRKWQLDYIDEKKKEYEEERLKHGKKKEKESEVQVEKINLAKGTIIHLKGDFNQLAREDLKERFAKFGYDIAYISFNKGDEEAFIRFHEENAAVKLLEKIGEEVDILETKFKTRLVEGDEETEFLKKAKEDRDAHFKKCQKARQGGRRGKGGRGRNMGSRKRKGSPIKDEATASKREADSD